MIPKFFFFLLEKWIPSVSPSPSVLVWLLVGSLSMKECMLLHTYIKLITQSHETIYIHVPQWPHIFSLQQRGPSHHLGHSSLLSNDRLDYERNVGLPYPGMKLLVTRCRLTLFSPPFSVCLKYLVRISTVWN